MRRRRRVLFLAGAVPFVVAAGYAVWRPNWVTASPAEIDRILGPELSRPVALDPVKVERFERFAKAFKRIQLTDVETIFHTLDPQEESALFWARNSTRIPPLISLMEKGPWQQPPGYTSDLEHGHGRPDVQEQLRFNMLMAIDGSSERDDPRRFLTFCRMGCRLSQRLVEGASTASQYSYGSQVREAVEKVIATARRPRRLNPSQLQELLDELDYPLTDGAVLREALRTQFRAFLYPALIHPVAPAAKPGFDRSEIAGNYNAFETTKLARSLYSEAMANVAGTYATLHNRVETDLNKQYDHLPTQPPRKGFSGLWADVGYRYQMRQIPNSFGIVILGERLYSELLLAQRMSGEAIHGLALGTIALQLYEKKVGRLPGSLAELCRSKLIKTALVDPYNGRPLRYDPARRLLWSVGVDMKDDYGTATQMLNSFQPDMVCEIPK